MTGDNEKRRLGWTEHRYYDSANLPNPLAEGTADERALPYESSAQVFTTGLFSIYGTDVTAAMLVAAGYVDRGADGWWATSGRQVFDATKFYLPTSVIDAVGRTTQITYDAYSLFVTAAATRRMVFTPWREEA